LEEEVDSLEEAFGVTKVAKLEAEAFRSLIWYKK
jgi:hypothetical protein